MAEARYAGARAARRAEWLSRTLDLGWGNPMAWRTPGVDAVVDAVSTGERLEESLRLLAWERAADGYDLDDALRDLNALWAVLEERQASPISRRQAHRYMINGWVDATADSREAAWTDPLSGLPTAGYLVTRVAELDRAAGPDLAELVLIALRWEDPHDRWLRMAMVIHAAVSLRRAASAEASFAQSGTNCVLALVPDDVQARLTRRRLVALTRCVPLGLTRSVAEIVPLPEDRTELAGLLRTLRTPLGPGPGRSPLSVNRNPDVAT